jgi:hypothetical protein
MISVIAMYNIKVRVGREIPVVITVLGNTLNFSSSGKYWEI